MNDHDLAFAKLMVEEIRLTKTFTDVHRGTVVRSRTGDLFQVISMTHESGVPLVRQISGSLGKYRDALLIFDYFVERN